MVAVPLPGEGPVHLVAVDDGVACPTQVVRTTAGEGISTVVVGQKIRWVLEMMRGPELAGARIARVERRTLDDGTAEFTFHDAAPGETGARPRSHEGRAAGPGRVGRDHRHPPTARAGTRGRGRDRRGPGLRLAHVPRRRGPRTGHRRARRRPGARERAPPGRGRPRRRHAHHRRRRRRRARPQPLRRRGRRRRHVQLLPADHRHRDRSAGSGHHPGRGGRAGTRTAGRHVNLPVARPRGR